VIKFNEKPLIICCLLGLTIWVGCLTYKQSITAKEKVVVESGAKEMVVIEREPIVVHRVCKVRCVPRPIYYYPPYPPAHFEYVHHRKAMKHYPPRAGFSISVRAPL